MYRIVVAIFLFGLFSCGKTTRESATEEIEAPLIPSFKSITISDSANLWWARTLHDVTGDGVLDIILQDNNGYGGWLGYLQGNTSGEPWQRHIIATTTPGGKRFAAGDLEAGDLDNDGDVDIIGVEHPGEWQDADAEAVLYWFENTGDGWIDHPIGTIPSALKDISIEDLNNDQLPEIITVTFNAETMSLFSKSDGTDFKKVWELVIDNLHEGMDVGDVDGNGTIDILANGYFLPNPGTLEGPWEVRTVDPIWYNQEEDHWARNATKVACRDIDGDGRDEVFISHSEKAGYPVARYDLENGAWKKEVILDELPAAHSLLIEDVDLDGDFEVLTGVNRHRARDIAKENESEQPAEYPVIILDQDDTGSWTPTVINTDGVYNLLGGDVDADGDLDLIRLTTHDRNDMWLMINSIR